MEGIALMCECEQTASGLKQGNIPYIPGGKMKTGCYWLLRRTDMIFRILAKVVNRYLIIHTKYWIYKNGKCTFTTKAYELLVTLNRCQSTLWNKKWQMYCRLNYINNSA
jgi:hypothetical protein